METSNKIFAYKDIQKNRKKQRLGFTSFCFSWNFPTKRITFRDSRQKQLTSYGRVHDVQTKRDDHSLLPYAHGNHACSRDDDCAVEMFFSSFILFFVVILSLLKHEIGLQK